MNPSHEERVAASRAELSTSPRVVHLVGRSNVQFFLLVLLVIVHGQLSAEMDVQCKTIPDGFYAKHAIYLWLTTGMWIVGLIYPLSVLPLLDAFRLKRDEGMLRE